MKIKKLIAGAMIGSFIVIGSVCTTDMPTQNEAKVGIQSQETYTLEGLTEKFYDNKSFEIDGEITVFKGYDKYNGYTIKYQYTTDIFGELDTELMIIDNEDFKGEKAPPLFSMFGEIPPAPKENISITKTKDGNYLINDVISEYEITEKDGKISSVGNIKPWEKAKKLKEIKEKFERFKTMLKTEDTTSRSNGVNRYEDIKKFHIDIIESKDEPNSYSNNKSYYWYKLYSGEEHLMNVHYITNTNEKTLTIRADNYVENVEISYTLDGEVKSMTYRESFGNSTTFEKDKYIKDIYTQDQIKELFEISEKFHDRIEEKVKDLPEAEEYPYGYP